MLKLARGWRQLPRANELNVIGPALYDHVKANALRFCCSQMTMSKEPLAASFSVANFVQVARAATGNKTVAPNRGAGGE